MVVPRDVVGHSRDGARFAPQASSRTHCLSLSCGAGCFPQEPARDRGQLRRAYLNIACWPWKLPMLESSQLEDLDIRCDEPLRRNESLRALDSDTTGSHGLPRHGKFMQVNSRGNKTDTPAAENTTAVPIAVDERLAAHVSKRRVECGCIIANSSAEYHSRRLRYRNIFQRFTLFPRTASMPLSVQETAEPNMPPPDSWRGVKADATYEADRPCVRCLNQVSPSSSASPGTALLPPPPPPPRGSLRLSPEALQERACHHKKKWGGRWKDLTVPRICQAAVPFGGVKRKQGAPVILVQSVFS